MPEVYISTDVETDGPIPGPHSMLSFASAAFLPDKTLVDTFSANLKTLPGAVGDAATMNWWKQHPEKWAATRTDLQNLNRRCRVMSHGFKNFPVDQCLWPILPVLIFCSCIGT